MSIQEVLQGYEYINVFRDENGNRRHSICEGWELHTIKQAAENVIRSRADGWEWLYTASNRGERMECAIEKYVFELEAEEAAEEKEALDRFKSSLNRVFIL